jgi:galactokinase
VSTERSATWYAPGRVNVIGEHTDYNAGFALPFAIEQGCTARVSCLDEPIVVVSSAQRADTVRIPRTELTPGRGGWAGYAAGAVWVLERRGVDVPGLHIALDSTVPTGGGLSSSAALVCSVSTALNDLLGLGLSNADLLEVTRSVENDFVGAPTGGMDQLAALNCTERHALFCDMRTLAVQQVPFDADGRGLAVLVVDTRAEHRHASGEYRARRAGCERAAGLLGVTALRDIAAADLDAALVALPTDELRRYTRHIVTEDERVLRTVELLRADRLDEIGPLLTASHQSLRDDYRVSIAELDVAVKTLLDVGALGARMTGGGFGGSVIALISAASIDDATRSVTEAFAARGFGVPAAFTAQPSRGAHRVG